MNSTNNQQESPRRRVSFSDVKIREFDLTFTRAQHPHKKGPALSLDWKFTERKAESVVDYEQRRPARRSTSDLFICPQERRRRLIEGFGFTDAQLDRANNLFLVRRAVSVPSRIGMPIEQRQRNLFPQSEKKCVAVRQRRRSNGHVSELANTLSQAALSA